MLEEGSGKRGLIRVGLMVEVNGSGEYAQGGPPLIGPSPMAGRMVRVRVRINVMRRARWGEQGMMMMAPKKNAEKSVNVHVQPLQRFGGKRRSTCNGGIVANDGQRVACVSRATYACVCVCASSQCLHRFTRRRWRCQGCWRQTWRHLHGADDGQNRRLRRSQPQ